MSILLNEFTEKLNSDTNVVGDVLEFGTGTGNSTMTLGGSLTNKKIFTFDGFVGLPKTNKGVPTNTGWEEGSYQYDYDVIKNKLSTLPNVTVIKRMSWDLNEPSEFEITKVSGINIDFDLYEGTLDALRFTQKCEWSKIFVRFDDWGSYPHQIASEVDAHEKAAFYDWINETGYTFKEYTELTTLSSGLQSLFEVHR